MKEKNEEKEYEKKYLFYFAIEIKVDGPNIYKQYIHFRLTIEI